METGSVATGEFQLQYFHHGTGPEEIVLVHGYSSSARIWRLAQEALATDVMPSQPQRRGIWGRVTAHHTRFFAEFTLRKRRAQGDN